MSFDLLLAGVGGQGVLSAARVLAEAAVRAGLYVKQGELHGMSQRGGSVTASLRMSNTVIHSDLIPRGRTRLVLATEPVEAFRALGGLSPTARVITSVNPFRDGPEVDLPVVLEQLRRLPRSVLLDAERVAREAGSARAANVVLIGAASPFLPIPAQTLGTTIADAFQPLGPRLVEANLEAYAAGRSLGLAAVEAA